jgi:alpha-L-fucosidase
MKIKIIVVLLFAACFSWQCNNPTNNQEASQASIKIQTDSVRVQNLLNLKWGMFLHWSLGTFSNQEWTKDVTDVNFFNTTSLNTDQWCKAAKDAGMGYIIFVAKHHDGFCLWNTKTTDFNVMNSPLKKDVLAELRKSCDKYGIQLCLYFSEGDWRWPDYKNPEAKKAQLTELFTNYGEIPLIWLDVAQWDGGLSHSETEALIRHYQPNTFIGVNHGQPAGDLQSREMGTFQAIEKNTNAALTQHEIDSLVTLNEKFVLDLNWQEAARVEHKMATHYKRYLAAECAICINQLNDKWYWFYNIETEHNAIAADRIYNMYQEAIKNKVLLSLALGPNRKGELRAVDLSRLKEVGEKIRNGQ